MEILLSPEIWIAFLTLLALEIVLGIDNIIFISILVDKLPEERQQLARRLGLVPVAWSAALVRVRRWWCRPSGVRRAVRAAGHRSPGPLDGRGWS